MKNYKYDKILKVKELITAAIKPQPFISRYLLIFCRKILEPAILDMGFKISSNIFIKNLYEIKDITGIIPKTIFDIGASLGKWSRAAHFVFPDATIYAFEPVQWSFELLKKNTRDIPKIKLFNFALSNFNGPSTFWLNDINDVSSLLKMTTRSKLEFPASKNAKIINITCRRLDSISGLKIEQPCYVKIDVEGAEKFVLEGMGELVKKIDILQLEYFFIKYYEGQTNLTDILSIIQKYDFGSPIEINTTYSRLDGSKLMSDLVFVRKKI